MKEFWENNLVEIAAYYSVSVLCLVIFLSVFELVTTYKNWEEIQKETWRLRWQQAEKF